MNRKPSVSGKAILFLSLLASTNLAFGQCATCGAEFNRNDNAQSRYRQYEPGLISDPVGNALIGGASSGVIRGAAAGATSVVTGTAKELLKNQKKEKEQHSNSCSNCSQQ